MDCQILCEYGLANMKEAALGLLERIEQQEMLSLSWGFADGSLSWSAAMQLADEIAEKDGGVEDSEELLEYLIEKRLVFELNDECIRSRFAETVRLLTRLKQLFPGRPWQGAPRLVTDFRVDTRRRKYPRRDRSAEALLRENANILSPNPLRRKLWSTLTNGVDLAAFQERATLRLLEERPDSGTIITAGTGSGKTLAFYLPALLKIAESVRAKEYWVKTLAIYPRVELLKDQLSEVFSKCREIDKNLQQERPLSIGALFGTTPNYPHRTSIKYKWENRNVGFICPWFRCPSCGGVLIWFDKDITQRREVLNCFSEGCGYKIPEGILILTRESLLRRPPDILFTTTEMLNSRMSDLENRALFGIGVPWTRKPFFALLDEVHTYVGTTGAQAALVLRRWRHLLEKPVIWCGLSATLGEASRFFSELTGVDSQNVQEITPQDAEMVEEGAEHQVILKGDPTLQTSLLSTSIQATMLVARMMDTVEQNISEGVYGNKVFVFTDDLDVTNRLFDNMRDAEAYDIFGRVDSARLPLAALRGAEPVDPSRDANGQRWRSCEEIGRNLNDRLRVGRTTSQDAGVLDDADVIVATATLEVGYNDSRVGAVLQHKAPRNMASFLQRKGRSGRMRGMRPLTVTVLSDYGRDRMCFEAYEHLFDPALPPQFLPVENQYILRMQAVFSMMDWLCADVRSGGGNNNWAWAILSMPTDSSDLKKVLRSKVAQLAKGDPQAVDALSKHLSGALAVSDEAITSILWDPPRSLMLEVIPTLARRLFCDWCNASGKGMDLQVDYHPLPDFIPRNLFSDLSLPEVQLILPPATIRDEEKKDALPIVQALRQFAPGRVTRRFAHQRGALCHWVPIDVESRDQVLNIGDYAEQYEYLGDFEGSSDNGSQITVPVYRPWLIRLSQAQRSNVLPTSNAFPVWFGSFEGRGTPVGVAIPSRSPWHEYVSGVNFYLHRFRSSVAVRRFSPEVLCNIRRLQGDMQAVVRYGDGSGGSAALGFELEVDGMCIDFMLPSDETLLASKLNAELQASSRFAYFRYLLLIDPELPSEMNTLQREWLRQILMSAAISRALQDDTTLGVAVQTILDDDPVGIFSRALDALFSFQELATELAENAEEEDEDSDSESGQDERISRLEESLRASLGLPNVIARLRALASELDCPTPDRYAAWLRRTLQETLAEALLQACINTAPRQAATDTLVADLEQINTTEARIWITETTLGGAGVIQAFAEAFTSEPRALFRALEAAIAPTDLELANQGLKEFVRLACVDQEVQDLTAKMRGSTDHVSRAALRRELYVVLGRKGIDTGHAFSISLNARVLRLGSSPEWDRFLAMLMQEWDELEARFSVSIGVREMCFAALQIPRIRDELVSLLSVDGPTTFSDAELIQILGGSLWPRGIEIRQRTLQSYNPFRERRLTDPALVRSLLLEVKYPPIHIDSPDWQDELALVLETTGTACLVIERTKEVALRSALIQTLATPVDIGFFQFYPMIEGVERMEKETKVLLTLREHV